MADPASLDETVIVDGNYNGPCDSGPRYYVPASSLFEQVLFGVSDFDNGYPNDFDMRNIKIGSEGFGSDDLWNPTFSSSLVPPFDSYVGIPGDMSVSGGVITVNNAGVAAYGVHNLAAGRREIWVQYDLYLRDAMFGIDGSFTAGFHDLLNQSGDQFGFVGMQYNDAFGASWVDECGTFFDSALGDPGAPTPDTWMTVQYYAQIIGGSNGKLFDHAALHKAHS